MTVSVDVSGTREVALELEAAGARVALAVRAAVQESGEMLEAAWRANATTTAGRHGKWYPRSIKSKMLFGLSAVAEVGPTEGMRQGAMSFEYGSTNQPPHLDGLRALQANTQGIRARIINAVYDSVPS